MTVKQRTSFSFDTASLLLFAALSMGGSVAAFAQTGGPAFGPGPSGAPRTATTASSSDQAFDRADANKDGKLSPQEAASLPAVGNRFQQLDTDKDGMLSREEFEKGVKQQP